MPRVKDLLGFAFLFTFLTVPMAYYGLTQKRAPWTPRLLTHYYNAAELFTRRQKTLAVDYIQLRFSPDGPWRTLREPLYFPMTPSGRRTRLTMFTNMYFRTDNAIVRLAGAELAEWIRARFRELNPGAPEPESARMLRATVEVGPQAGRRPEWETPPLESFEPGQVRLVYEHRYE